VPTYLRLAEEITNKYLVVGEKWISSVWSVVVVPASNWSAKLVSSCRLLFFVDRGRSGMKQQQKILNLRQGLLAVVFICSSLTPLGVVHHFLYIYIFIFHLTENTCPCPL
jgi:hypothetical protein